MSSYIVFNFNLILMHIVLELWCAGREIGATGHCCRFVRESHSPSSSDMGRNSWKHFGGQKIYSVKTNLFIHGILKLKRAVAYFNMSLGFWRKVFWRRRPSKLVDTNSQDHDKAMLITSRKLQCDL